MPPEVGRQRSRVQDLTRESGVSLRPGRILPSNDNDSSQDMSRSSFVLRKAFADGAEVQREIDRMTEHALMGAPRILLMTHSKQSRRFIEGAIESAKDAREFFQNTLGSRMTVMDLIGIADIASPLLNVREIDIEHSVEEGEHSMTLRMGYAARDDSLAEFSNIGFESRTSSITVVDGRPTIEENSIFLTDGTKNKGLGLRHLLAMTLFAKRHGIPSWEDDIQQDGLLVWPALGAKVPQDRIDMLGAKIVSLFTSGMLEGRAPARLGYFDIAAFTALGSQVRDWGAFHLWLQREARIPLMMIEEMPADSMPIGAMMMQRHAISAEFEVEHILPGLLEERIPQQIERRRDAVADAEREDDISRLALEGLEQHYYAGMLEYGVYNSAFDARTMSTVSAAQLAVASGMIMSGLR